MTMIQIVDLGLFLCLGSIGICVAADFYYTKKNNWRPTPRLLLFRLQYNLMLLLVTVLNLVKNLTLG